MSAVAAIRQDLHVALQAPFIGVRTTHASRQPYALHFHDTFSVGVVFAGETIMTNPEGQTRLCGGDVVLIAPGEVHSCNPSGPKGRSYHMFHVDAAWALSRLESPDAGRLITRNRVVRNRGIFFGLMQLAADIRSGDSIVGNLEMLERVVRENCRVDSTRANKDALSRSRELLLSSCDDSGTTIAAMAADMGMARETFIRSFRRATGMTPGSYRQCLRLDRAARLLREGAGIADVAAACGFSDQSHLHRMCVKFLSATPSQLRCFK